MAIIIPDSALGDRAYGINAGEKYLLNKLKAALPDDCIVWHNIDLLDHYQPDVVAYLPGMGIIIFEVKDWESDTVVKIDTNSWEIYAEGRHKTVRSPLEQVRNYYWELAKLFQKKQVLLRGEGNYKGSFKLPITYAAAFTSIRRKDLPAEALPLLDPRKFLFRDDLEPLGNTVTGPELAKYLRSLFSQAYWPNAPLTPAELDSLRGALYPEITLTKNHKSGPKKIILDITQEQMAKKADSGHTIVRGIAGSGKSLVLCAKAKIIAEAHPDWKTLVMCFNNSLKSQLDFYLAHLNDIFITKPAKPNWQIAAFYGFLFNLAKELGHKLPDDLFHHEGESDSDEKASATAGEHLQRMAAMPGAPRFNAILVDESQDFHHSWLKGLLAMLKPGINCVILAEDPNQKIYKRNFTYKDAGINAVGRVRKLPVAYRSTKEIILPATLLVQNSNPDEFFKQYVGEDNFATLFKEAGGNPPVVEVVPGDMAGRYLMENICNDVKAGLAYSDIAVLCPAKYQTQKYFECLSHHNIPAYWLVQSAASKKDYDAAQDRVLISTVHSAKGLEFEKVYFMNLETFPLDYLNERENASMIYVAMTRAKKNLTIVSGSRTETFSRIRETVQKYCADDGG